MTLLDAPVFDEARDRRRKKTLKAAAAALVVFLVGFWFAAGHPVDYPWYWHNHLRGRIEVNAFFKAVEKDDLAAAYGIWTHDKNWQQHPQTNGAYPFSRFQGDWSATSPDNEYGAIQSHQIALAGHYGNGVLVAVLINGRKSKALNLEYDPHTKSLDFAPPGVELYLGP